MAYKPSCGMAQLFTLLELRMLNCHDLKLWPQFFPALARGEKTFEIRKNDRNFQVGDGLRLREWDPVEERYTGREVQAEISYVLSGWGLEEGFVCLGLKDAQRAQIQRAVALAGMPLEVLAAGNMAMHSAVLQESILEGRDAVRAALSAVNRSE